jgi:hypothetical protein
LPAIEEVKDNHHLPTTFKHPKGFFDPARGHGRSDVIDGGTLPVA